MIFLGVKDRPVFTPAPPVPAPDPEVEPEPVIIPTVPPIVVEPLPEQPKDIDVPESQPDKPVEVIPEPSKEEPVTTDPAIEVEPTPAPIEQPKPAPVIVPVTPKPDPVPEPLPPAAEVPKPEPVIDVKPKPEPVKEPEPIKEPEQPKPTPKPEPVKPPTPEPLSLKQSPIKWGVAVKESDLDKKKMMDEVEKQFGSVSGENGFKIGHIMQKEGKPDFTHARKLINFANPKGIRVHAHCCFVWPTQQGKLAKFFHEAAKDKDKYIALMKSVIQTFAKEFKGKVGGVDIVNEAHDDAGNLRPSYALTHMGPNYIEQLCKWYLEVDKDAKLFISDFGFETDSKKAGIVIKYAGELKKKGLIQGISSQMHVTKKFDYDKFKKRLDEMAKLNLLVHLSEIDIMHCRAEDEPRKAEIFRDVAKGFRTLPKSLQYGCTVWSHTNEGNFYNYQLDPKPFTPVIFDKNFNGGLTLPAILEVK